MRVAEITSIFIPPARQRQEFDADALQELADSIAARGLMHPPVMRKTEGGPLTLVAGERRMRAVQLLHDMGTPFRCDGQLVSEGDLPYTLLGDLNPLEAEEAELDENLKRKDLTWQERTAAEARLHKLRVQQKAQAQQQESPIQDDTGEWMLPPSAPHTVADTAKELYGRSDGDYQSKVRTSVLVAKHLNDPDVAKAASAKDALKILKQKEQQQEHRVLAAAVGKTFTSDVHRAFNSSCLLDMVKPEFQGYFDAICTDPPYGMGADEFGDGGGKLQGIEHAYKDDYEHWKDLMSAWTALSFHVTKPQAHAYVFCDIDRFHELKAMMTAAGWDVFRTPLIVHKINSGRVPRPEHGPRRQWEMILYAIKGNKPVTHIYPDVIPCEGDTNLGHGAQKPVALFQNLLQRSIKPGDRVGDFFAGTGPLLPAAHKLQCEATVWELNPEHYAKCVTRLKELKAWETPGLF